MLSKESIHSCIESYRGLNEAEKGNLEKANKHMSKFGKYLGENISVSIKEVSDEAIVVCMKPKDYENF